MLADYLDDAKRLHATVLVADIHSDIPTDVFRRRSVGESSVIARLHLPRLRTGGVSLCGMAVNNDSFVGGLQPDLALRRVVEMLDAMEAEAAETPAMTFVKNGQEVREAYRQQRLAYRWGWRVGPVLARVSARCAPSTAWECARLS